MRDVPLSGTHGALAGRPLQPRSPHPGAEDRASWTAAAFTGCAEPSSEHTMKIKLLPKGGKRINQSLRSQSSANPVPHVRGAAHPGGVSMACLGANGAPRHGAAAGVGSGESRGWGRKKRGPHGPAAGLEGGKRAGVPAPGGGTPSRLPAPGQCLGKRGPSQSLDTGAQGPPAAHTPQPPGLPGQRPGTQGRTTVLLPSEPPHQQAAAASKVSDGKQQTRGDTY